MRRLKRKVKLVQIVLEIPRVNPMMCPVEQGFKIAEHAVDMRSDPMGSLGGCGTLFG